MNRLKSLFTLFIIICCNTADALTFTVINDDGINISYSTTSSTTVEVTTKQAGLDYQGDIIIPSKVIWDGVAYSVTSIGKRAFDGCSVTSVIIPNSVISIQDEAFRDCAELTSVTIPNSVTSIGICAFIYCYELTGLTIPDSVTSIQDGAFNSCTKLTAITLPKSLGSIAAATFLGCRNLKEITIPETVTSLGMNAFLRCSSLESITIAGAVTSIGKSAFEQCSGLKNVSIGASVSDIQESAFAECTAIQSLVIEDSPQLLNIADYAFDNCQTENLYVGRNVNKWLVLTYGARNKLKTISFSEYVTEIGTGACSYCKSLTNVIIPNSVTTIGRSTFDHCPNLKEITIGSSVSNIGDYAFSNCPKLNKINGKGASEDNRCCVLDGKLLIFAPAGLTSYTLPTSVTDINAYVFSDCTGLISLTIPNSVTTIEYEAFTRCSNLNKVIIPESINKIEGRVFCGCTGLKEIKILKREPTIDMGDRVFLDVPVSTCSLYVPKGSKALYQAAEQWKQFTNYCCPVKLRTAKISLLKR